MISRIEKISVRPRATSTYAIASPKPFSKAWTRRLSDIAPPALGAMSPPRADATSREGSRLLLESDRRDLGQVDELAVADLRDNNRVQELTVDPVGVLAADHHRAPDRLVRPARERGQHLVGVQGPRFHHR